jgi:HSP20 family molecular chaperone IbpA
VTGLSWPAAPPRLSRAAGWQAVLQALRSASGHKSSGSERTLPFDRRTTSDTVVTKFEGSEDVHPFLTMHREMNRMFDEVFRGFDLTPLSMERRLGGLGWPNIDIDETEKEIRVTVELPGLDEKDVELQIANGVLSISGERKSEAEDKERRFSERFFGRFERRIPSKKSMSRRRKHRSATAC